MFHDHTTPSFSKNGAFLSCIKNGDIWSAILLINNYTSNIFGKWKPFLCLFLARFIDSLLIFVYLLLQLNTFLHCSLQLILFWLPYSSFCISSKIFTGLCYILCSIIVIIPYLFLFLLISSLCFSRLYENELSSSLLDYGYLSLCSLTFLLLKPGLIIMSFQWSVSWSMFR